MLRSRTARYRHTLLGLTANRLPDQARGSSACDLALQSAMCDLILRVVSWPGRRRIDSETLRQHLKTIGVDNLQVRTATLLDLAAEVPASILADLVGLYPTTATRWTRAAGGDWAGYVATRTARH